MWTQSWATACPSRESYNALVHRPAERELIRLAITEGQDEFGQSLLARGQGIGMSGMHLCGQEPPSRARQVPPLGSHTDA